MDGYIAKQPEPRPSRSEMNRKIVIEWLVAEGLLKTPACEQQ